MTEEDVALFHQAEQHAKSGRQLEAYNLFRLLRERNPDTIEILFWIVETTPHAGESEQALVTIKQLQPNHPWIPRTEAVHQRRFGKAIIYAQPPPVLLCPYCSTRAAAQIKTKVSTGGWIWFAVFFVLFICFLSAPVPVYEQLTTERVAFICLGVSIIGLFAIRKRLYFCGHCGSRITDAD